MMESGEQPVVPADVEGGQGGDEMTAQATEPTPGPPAPTMDAGSSISESASSAVTAAPAGWHPDPYAPGSGRQRYWDGTRWTDSMSGGDAPASASTAHRSLDERKAILAQQLQGAAARGLRVESQGEFQAVLAEGAPVNHTLHAIVSIFSCGLWVIPWVIITVNGGVRRHMVTVDEFGNVMWQNLGKAKI